MSKAKGPFDAAIKILREQADYCHHQWADPSKIWGHRDEYDNKELVYINGIRVLEAAGKVPKWGAINYLGLIQETQKELLGTIGMELVDSLMALAVALPDPEGEKK